MKSITDWTVRTNVNDSSADFAAPETRYVRLDGQAHDGARSRHVWTGWIVAVGRDRLGNPVSVETLSGSVYHLGRPEQADGFQALASAWDKLGGYTPGVLAYLRP